MKSCYSFILIFLLSLSLSHSLTPEVKITDVLNLEVYRADSQFLGIIQIALFGELYPKTVNEMISECSVETSESVGLLYRGVQNFLVQGYIRTSGKHENEIGVEEINLSLKHHEGSVALAQAGPGPSLTKSNSKFFQNFFILLSESPFLDSVHLIVGHVVGGLDLVQNIVKEYFTEKSEYFEKPPFVWKCSVQSFKTQEMESLSYALFLKEIPSQEEYAFEYLNKLIDSQKLTEVELYQAMYALTTYSEKRKLVPFEEIRARYILLHEYTGRAEPLCDLAFRYNEKKNFFQAHLFSKYCSQAKFPSSLHKELISHGNTYEANQLSYFYNVTRFDFLGSYAYSAGEYQDGYDAIKTALQADPTNERLNRNLQTYNKALGKSWN